MHNSEVWTGNVFEEEVLVDFLLGKKVDVSHINSEIKTIEVLNKEEISKTVDVSKSK